MLDSSGIAITVRIRSISRTDLMADPGGETDENRASSSRELRRKSRTRGSAKSRASSACSSRSSGSNGLVDGGLFAVVNDMGFMARLRVAGKGFPADVVRPRLATRRFEMAAAEEKA